jgi:hypothetical protein
MPENRSDLQVAPVAAAADQAHARMPFEAPAIEELGSLGELTLVSVRF